MSTLQLAHATPSYWPVLLLAALISAAVSIVGYWHSARAKRLDRQRQVFADAFRSITEYREFVYKVRRRPPGTDRSQITDDLSAVQAQLNLHRATLEIEAPVVARHYVRLVEAVRRIVGPHISEAWEQPPPARDSDMQTHYVDLTDLAPFEAAYVRACTLHLRRVLRIGRSPRPRDSDDSPVQHSKIQDYGDNPPPDSIYENYIDDSSGWKLIKALFGKFGLGVIVTTVALGMWLSANHRDSLSSALGDMITPAAVMISSAVVIAVWIAGPQRLPRPGKRVPCPDDLLGLAWIFSCFAIVGIGLAVIFRTLPPETPTEILQPLGGLALALMSLVLVGLTRILLLCLRSISRRLPERAVSLDNN